MKRLIIISVILLISQILLSQNKKLKLEDYINPAMYPTSLKQLQWKANTNRYTYVVKQSLVEGSTDNQKKDTLTRLADINKQFIKESADTLKRFPIINWINNESFWFVNQNKLMIYHLKNSSVEQENIIADNAENIDVQDNSLNIAFTIDNNLYVACDNKIMTISSDTNKGIVYGQAVHRNEFGIEKGTFWSPKGDKLAFYRMDESMVTTYPLVDIETRPAQAKMIRYPMAGMTSHQVTVGVYDVQSNKTIYLSTSEPKDQYLTNITWSPDEKYIYISVLNRDQNYLKLNQYDVKTGAFVKTLFEEKNEKYVEPLTGLFFLNNHNDQFIWQSQRDGFNHLYLYDINGRLIKQLTKGPWVVSEFIGFDKENQYAFFVATKDNPLDQLIYSVSLVNGNINKISSDKGQHNALLSKDGNYIIENFSSIDNPNEYKLFTKDGKLKYSILKSADPLKDYKLGTLSIFTIKSKDSCNLYCRMIKPTNFDPAKKYPVIVYVYGGPHNQMISDTWLGGAGFFLNYLAQQGYIVFSLDNHGSSYRGLAFEQAIFRNVGVVEGDDQMRGVAYLKTLPYVDTTRIGVHGWSYGGFMTITMMLNNPKVFKAAVAGGPVIDWKYYEVMYGERYMDTPEENPEGYEQANLLDKVDSLSGKLLIIHGTVDPTVVWQNSLMFLKKCVDKGKQVDYFVYPGHEHNIMGKDRIHMFRKIENYFNENL